MSDVAQQPFTIRCLKPHEWQLLKALRVRALAEAPQSYWETADEVGARDDVYWMTFARKLTTPGGSRMFIVGHDESVAGFIFGVKHDGDEYRVGGLWVDPMQRRKGLGTSLVQEVVRWAKRDSNTAVIQLWCPIGSTESFYERNGFHSLNRFRPHDADGRQIVEMEISPGAVLP